MTGKNICDLMKKTMPISLPSLYQKLCDWGYLERKDKITTYECKHRSKHPGILIVTDPGIPYERPDFSFEVIKEILDRFLAHKSGLKYGEAKLNLDVIKKIIDNENLILTPQDSNILGYLRRDFKNQYGTTIHHYYLKSQRWANKRQATFKLCGEICYRCGWAKPKFPESSVNSLHVHHLTYANWVDELSEELIPLCTACHEWIHKVWDQDTQHSPFVKRYTDSLRHIKEEIKLSTLIISEDLA